MHMQLGTPTKVEKYEILEEIGRGGMATVYRARDLRLQRLVALKVMHPHLQGAKEARARFTREALTVARLRHPGLLEIFDYSGEDSDVGFIATELLTGPTLKRFCEQHRDLSAEAASCIAIQVADALAAAHAAGVIHRDVKPENIMFHEGRVKLTDFGIAQLLDVQGMTTTGQVLGSPGHMAPEQIEGKDCTPRTDIFALGTVLFGLATGELPFTGRNPHQVLKKIIEGDFRDPLQVNPRIGSLLRGIIVRCLELDPTRRYSSATELATALRAFVAEVGIEDPSVWLRDYLKDPAGFSQHFTTILIEQLTELGQRAARSRDYAKALAYWNRVLAIDDGNERVLAEVRNLSTHTRRHRMAFRTLWVALFCVAVASLGLVFKAAVPRRGVEEPIARDSKAGASRSSGPDSGAGTPRQPPSKPVLGTGVPHVNDAAVAADAGAVFPPDAGAKRRKRGVARKGRSKHSRSFGVKRVVRFRPYPANVSIAVDGGPLKPYGPSFREVELTPGKHFFRIVGAHGCCVDESFSAIIAPGREPWVVRRRLQFRPAGLYVVSNVPADVTVDGTARGRTRSVIQISQPKSLTAAHDVQISAPDHTSVNKRVQLRAGEVTTVHADLSSDQP